MRTPPVIPPRSLLRPEGETVSKFDRHYATRRAKRRRDASLALFGLSLVALAVMSLDPLFSHQKLEAGWLWVVGLLCAVFLSLTLNFHLRYRSRD